LFSVIERNVETETIVPDVEMTDINERVQADHIYTTANQTSQNMVFQTKPTLQRVPASAVQVIFQITFAAQSNGGTLFAFFLLSDEAKC